MYTVLEGSHINQKLKHWTGLKDVRKIILDTIVSVLNFQQQTKKQVIGGYDLGNRTLVLTLSESCKVFTYITRVAGIGA